MKGINQAKADDIHEIIDIINRKNLTVGEIICIIINYAKEYDLKVN